MPAASLVMARESPFTAWHGYGSLELCPFVWDQILSDEASGEKTRTVSEMDGS